MPRRKIYRTPEEEAEFRRLSKERKTISQRLRRNKTVRSLETQHLIPTQTLIRGTFHQNDDRFSSFSRGKQCTANAAVSIAMSVIRSVSLWNSDIIDLILTYGDQLYVESMARRRSVHEDEMYRNYLAVDDLQNNLEILSMNCHFTLGQVIYGHLYIDNSEIGCPNIQNGLSQFFNSFNSGILTCNGISIAIGQYEGHFWIFDSHSRDSNGRTSSSGTACFVKFVSISCMLTMLMNNISHVIDAAENQYNITPVYVTLDGNRATRNRILNLEQELTITLNVNSFEETVIINQNEITSQTVDDNSDSTPLLTGANREICNQEIASDDKSINRTKDRRQIRARQRSYNDVNFSSILNCEENINEHYTGLMDISCSQCGAKHFRAEKVANKSSFNDCCSHGEGIVPNLRNPPEELLCLFNNVHDKSRRFFERIRSYNSSLSFASFNANLVNFNARRPGPYCFKIQGQIYYQINTAVHPAANERPAYGQLFIVDPDEATEHRLHRNSELDRELLQILERIIRENNEFAAAFVMMKEEIQNQQELMTESSEVLPELQLMFLPRNGFDRHRYNFQKCNEVAAVFSTTADGEIPETYVTIRDRNTKILKNVSTMDENVEPWVYPLFFPFGDPGWSRRLRRTNEPRKNLSRAAYVKYRIAIRNNESNVFLLGRRLFQQWLVDSYVKIEKDRIEYCRNHQKELRSESYQGLIDYLEERAHNENTRVGKMIILPSTFSGSPRNMMQMYQDSMAIVRRYGKPDLFITMTCSPKWKEIKENLLDGQKPADRPDICARVFDVKKDYLVDLIVRQSFFGKVAAYVYVIEFQKRGLPHIHMLVTLKTEDKIKTPEMINRYISAEIPDPDQNPILHNIVMKNMIHGPCGDWCFKDGKCSKHYPKQFREETTMDADNYPSYRRRDTGNTYERPGNYMVNNRHVVPYSPVLLQTFNCHINVEVVSSTKSVKYLYKYVYKGHDAASITIGENVNENSTINHDEIQDFIEARYVGPVEAAWRIFGKSLQDKSHAVIRLPVHLPNEQNITFSNENSSTIDHEELLRSAVQRTDMLMDYFALNLRDETARQYYYTEIPCHYTFRKYKINNQIVHRWEPRRSHFNCIGRMYSISPSQVELFHLRLLLLSVKGATSFHNLKTVDGDLKQTYVETCLALGLIEDDEEWKRTMDEATTWMMPQRLRRLFVRLLIHCHPANPRDLWDEFKDDMSEDYARHLGQERGRQKAYAAISRMLCSEGQSLSDFPQMEQIYDIIETDEDEDHEDYSIIGQEKYKKLNEQQKQIVDTILNELETNNTENNIDDRVRCFYIDGPGGSGKTFVYTTLWHLLKAKKKKVATMAFTGIAAILLPQGKTVHKTLGLPVPLYADSTSDIKVQSRDGEFLKKVDIFIWDEAPMAPRYALEIMDRLLRDIMEIDVPFGGKIILLGGDFRQLLPVKIRGTRSETVNLSMKFSSLWTHFRMISLTKNMRVLPQEIEFSAFLLNLGNGTLNDANDYVQFPANCIINDDMNIVERIYGDHMKNKRYEQAAECAILSARNADVEEINKEVIKLLDESTEKIYASVNSIENCGDDNIGEIILPEYLNSLSPPSLPPHELRLRVNSIIMLIRNLSMNEGLCNGTRLLVLQLGNHLLQCKILTGDQAGEIVFLNRITLYCEDVYPFTFKRRQFPIKLAFAMTINKAQGQTFEKIGIDLRRDVFNHGQLYVACSRVRSWDSLKIFLNNDHRGENENKIKNYVYKELYMN